MSQPIDNKMDAEALYLRVIENIEEVEASRDKEISSVFLDKGYQDLIASWFGIEVISLYVTSSEEVNPKNILKKQIDFLYDPSSGEVTDFPMYSINVKDRTSEFGFTKIEKVDEGERNQRRLAQKLRLGSVHNPTSAELCARYLQQNPNSSYLLLSFGEIISYCFLFHILQYKIKNKKSDIQTAANYGWAQVKEAYEKRQDLAGSDIENRLLLEIKKWYFVETEQECFTRVLQQTPLIEGIYKINDEVKKAFESVGSSDLKVDELLSKWAEDLYNSFVNLVTDGDLEKNFFQHSLVNPLVEERLCTRGLYVTIISSPLHKGVTQSHLSQAYAICTIVNPSLLADIKFRKKIDHILRSLSYTRIAFHDYQKLKRIRDSQQEIQLFFNNVSSTSDNWADLLQAACRLCVRISSADYVLISLKEIGTFLLFKSVDSRAKESGANSSASETYLPAWFGSVSPVTYACNRDAFFEKLQSMENASIKEYGFNKFMDLITNKLETEYRFGEHNELKSKSSDLTVLHTPIYDKDNLFKVGIIMLFTEPSGDSAFDTQNPLREIAVALSIGMSMPFRNMINKGLISSFLKLLSIIWYFLYYLIFKKTHIKTGKFKKQSPNITLLELSGSMRLQKLLDFILGTMMELMQIGFILVATVFIMSVGELLLSSWEHLFSSDEGIKVTKVLKTIEGNVMTFSICLAATGILFLAKPELAFGQPRWMKKFAKPGTLEQTLVKLAAMVLTIDVLNVVLSLQEWLHSSTTYLWILVKPAIFHLAAYLIVLLGLAFLSEFLLKEKDKKEKEMPNLKEQVIPF